MEHGVIFDMDGVLVDSYQAHWESWRVMAAEMGQALSEAQFAQTFGRTSREIIAAHWGEGLLSPEQIARFDERKEHLYRELVECEFPAMDGAAELIRNLAAAGFRLALGKLPGSGAGLASQPTMSRWENAPTTRELARMMVAMIGVYCASYPAPPAAVTLDIDDTCDVVHGYQQLSFWNGHHGERCFLPIHVYDTASGRPVAMLLRTGKTPSGAEGAGHIRRLVRHIRQHWPDTHITIRGDGHYARPEIMAFCEAAGVDYVFGLPTNAALRADPAIVAVADACAVKRAQAQHPVLRNYVETRYGAKSWKSQRRVVARIEASTLGMDIRYVVTSLTEGSPEHIYDTLYCARGQAENLIKRHKTQLASDRTSCRSANANQMRLILHTAAYWLMWRVQQAIPKATSLATAEFATLRLRLLKVAARVIETASRIRVAFASACPDAGVFKAIATSLRPAPT